MTNKYFGGVVTDKGAAEEVDADLKLFVEKTPGIVEEKMENLRVADAITEIFNLFKRCNKYIDETMPWALAKEEDKKDRLETVLYNLIESIKKGAEAIAPFMPETAETVSYTHLDVYKRQKWKRLLHKLQQSLPYILAVFGNKR